MTGQRGHLLPHPPLTRSKSLSFYLLSAFCGLQEGVLTQQDCLGLKKQPKRHPLLPEDSGLTTSSSPPKRQHCYTLLWGTSVACLTYCIHRCCKHGSCSRSRSWLCRLSVIADLCADTSFGINQAYQGDRCLFTCYKHLPAPRLCFISTQIIYRRPASAPCPCLLFCCGSNISSSLPFF